MSVQPERTEPANIPPETKNSDRVEYGEGDENRDPSTPSGYFGLVKIICGFNPFPRESLRL